MQLLITGPDGSSSKVDLEEEPISLGRATDNFLAYPGDPALSRYHLCLEPRGDGWSVRDCGSRNGTVVNSDVLDGTHQLQPGDRIYVGHLTIEVHDSTAKSARSIVTFVPQESSPGRRQSTIVTNLNEVLGQERGSTSGSPLNATRAIRGLLRAGQELAGHRPLQELFEIILDLSLSAVEAKRGVILTVDGGQLAVRASKGDGFSISTSVRDRVMRDGSALLISDAQVDSALRQRESIIAQRVRSVMAVPLQTGDQVIGLIYVDNGTTFRPFSSEDLELLTVMANVAGVRIEHSRLAAIEQQEKVTQSELAQASEIQQNLLPAEPPEIDGYELAGFNLPCRAVGGDYYDFLSYGDERLGLFVADVCGKGLPAALMMSSLQASVQMLLETKPDAATALTILNRHIARRCPVGRFITAFFGLLELGSGEVQYANAGHNYPVLVRADGDIELLQGAGLVMGLFDTVQYQAHQAKLEKGDLLFLYSDGVTEASPPGGQQLGEQGLIKFLTGNRNLSCSEILSKLVDHVRSWSGAAAFNDDFTIVLVRRR